MNWLLPSLDIQSPKMDASGLLRGVDSPDVLSRQADCIHTKAGLFDSTEAMADHRLQAREEQGRIMDRPSSYCTVLSSSYEHPEHAVFTMVLASKALTTIQTSRKNTAVLGDIKTRRSVAMHKLKEQAF